MRGWGGWGGWAIILCTHLWCVAASRKLRKLAAEGCTLLTDTGLAAVCGACVRTGVRAGSARRRSTRVCMRRMGR